MHLVDPMGFDNSAVDHQHIEALPLAAAMGAEICGVQVAALDDEAFEEVGHATRSAFTCRLRWEAGTLALWDNCTCVHQAYNDHVGTRREMYRTTVKGEQPI